MNTDRNFSRGSRNRLFPGNVAQFDGDTLFDRVARSVCRAGCLPRKELYEAWEVARRIRRFFRGGSVVEIAAGHGLLSYLLLLLDRSSEHARLIDRKRPSSASRIAAPLVEDWPWLEERVKYEERAAPSDLELPETTLLVSVHACGDLTDAVLSQALASRCRVAVLPCCHRLEGADDGALSGWLPGPLAVDVTRAARLRAAGFHVRTLQIPDDITPQNRLLLGEPRRSA